MTNKPKSSDPYPCPWCDALVARADERCPDCGRSQLVCEEYRIRGLLGRGGMAPVYEARKKGTKKRVAVKIMRLEDTGEWKPRDLFARSTQVLQQLAHPLLPEVHAFSEDESGALVLVRESFDGGTLEERVRDQDWRCSRAEFVELAKRLLGLLDYLHTRVPPVIHRDIKPSNIMFRRPVGPHGMLDNEPALVDFDTVADAGGSGSTIVVSPGYTAPEQLASATCPESDLYSLGVTLLFVATHTPPDELPRGRDGRFDLGTRLDELEPRTRHVLAKLIEPDLSRRWSSAAEALEGLERGDVPEPEHRQSLETRPGESIEPGPKKRGLRLSQSHKTILLWLALILGFTLLYNLFHSSRSGEPAHSDIEVAREVEPAPPEPAPAPAPIEAEPVVCEPGSADCDGDPGSGCETHLATTAAHCGACGHACEPGSYCSASRCVEGAHAIAVGQNLLCEIRTGGAVYCRSDPFLPDRASTEVAGLKDVVQLAIHAYSHQCAVQASGQLLCWGDGDDRIGLGGQKRDYVPEPTPVPRVTDAQKVALFDFGTCVLTKKGQVFCFGFANDHEAGIASYESPKPRRVRGVEDAVDLASSRRHLCAVRRDGAVLCWGQGGSGQLGNGRRVESSAPVEVRNLADVRAVAAGQEYSCAVRTDGSVACWGANGRGQLGDGTTEDRLTPVTIAVKDAVAISAALQHACALTDAGSVWCWGPGSGGSALTSSAREPWQVELDGMATAVAVDGFSVCVLLADGRSKCELL